MLNLGSSETMIERVENIAIVSLKVGNTAVDEAIERLSLASPLHAEGSEPQSLWISPNQWQLVSRSQSSRSLIDVCNKQLSGLLFNAVDQSTGLAAFRIAGDGSRELLASGCGIDVRASQLKLGDCCRTRLAHILAIVVANGDDQFELLVDQSYANYFMDWLLNAARHVHVAAAGKGWPMELKRNTDLTESQP